MEGSAPANPAGSIAALFAIVAFIVGLCSRSSSRAFRWSAIIGTVCVAAFVLLLIAAGPSRDIDWSYAFGRFVGFGVGAVIFGMIGYGIRKLFSLFFGLFRRSKPESVNPEVSQP
jgi:amino acid permease